MMKVRIPSTVYVTPSEDEQVNTFRFYSPSEVSARCESHGKVFSKASFGERMCQVAITGGLPQLLCSPSVGRTSCDPHMDHLARWQFDDEEGEERTEEQVGDLQAHRRPRYPRHDCEGRSPSSAHVVESCAPVSCISEWCVC